MKESVCMVCCSLPGSWPSSPPWIPGHPQTVSTAPVSAWPAGSSRCTLPVGCQTPGGRPRISPTWRSGPAHSQWQMKRGVLCFMHVFNLDIKGLFEVQCATKCRMHLPAATLPRGATVSLLDFERKQKSIPFFFPLNQDSSWFVLTEDPFFIQKEEIKIHFVFQYDRIDCECTVQCWLPATKLP